jgi:putative ABC transport system permease protein
MLKSYLKISWRVIRKNGTHSVLNIAGLAVGLAVAVLIFFWVRDELGYDRFHQNAPNLHLVYSDIAYSDGRTNMFTQSYYPLAKALRDDCPEVLEAVRIMEAQGVVISRGDLAFSNDTILLADPSFFAVFSFPLVKGDPKTALAAPTGVILTESAVRKYFGDENPMGKTLTIEGQIDALVTGIARDVPANSSIRFNMAVPFHFAWGGPQGKEPQHWGGNPLNTYVLLRPGSSIPEVELKTTAAVTSRMNASEGMTVKMGLQPITRIHLHALEGGGPILVVVTFAAVALLVLAVACFNFVNLTTARATARTNEVGLRKVVGAGRADLVKQFFGESVLVAFLSFLLALLLVALALPAFNALAGKSLSLQNAANLTTLAGLVAIALLTGVLAGTYPALVLSSLRPARLFKTTSTLRPKGALARKILVVAQYTISISLILGTVVIHRQLGLMTTTDLGYDKTNLLLVDLPEAARPRFEAFKQELLRLPGVSGVTRSVQTTDNINSTVSALDWEGRDPAEKISMNWDYVDYDYIETLKMTIIEGRSFSPDFPSDLGKAYIVNEEAVRVMGLESPVGQRLSMFRNEGTIIGVVKNFNFKPLRHRIAPIVLGLDPDWIPNMGSAFVRLEPGRVEESLRAVEATFKELFPGVPFMSWFFDYMTDRHYRTEQRMERIIGVFTLLALFISALGLFGLASFTAERRTKEIGIRKVLGATAGRLVADLTGQFAGWVLLANLLAWPAAYLAASSWLRNYAYRARLEPWIFVAAGAISLTLALLTVGFKALRVAAADPVDALRYE